MLSSDDTTAVKFKENQLKIDIRAGEENELARTYQACSVFSCIHKQVENVFD